LFLNISEVVLVKLIVEKRSVQEEERHPEGTGLNFIPFDDGATDIVSTHEKIRLRKSADGPLSGKE
jgi:hypothetical protein